jgi:hypothetical protein
MNSQFFSNPKFLYTLLVLQFIPLLLNTPSVFVLTSQEWWLPALLVLMSLVGTIQVFCHKVAPWSLSLISFAHGFNIISRLMILLPKSTSGASFDGLYFSLTLVAMLISTFMLWLLELPQARQILTR